VISILIGLAIGAVLLAAVGANPFAAYRDMVTGTLGSRSDIGLVLVEVVPLLIIGLGLALAFRARIWNIGAEGQFVMGALFGAWFAIQAPVSNPIAMVGLTWIVASGAGALWGSLVGWLKSRWGVNEVITSLLLNYVAVFILGYMVRKPLRATRGFQPVSERLPAAARLPELPGGLPVHIGLLPGLILVPILVYVLRSTPFGFRLRMMGLNPDAAQAASVPTRAMYIRVMALSGAFAGLAGVIQVMGPETRLTNNLTAAGYGFTAIVVALIGRLHPVGVLAAAFFIGSLTLAGDVIQRTQGVPRTMTLVLQTVFVVVLLVADRVRRR
jgi:simple sugar transport system permease protein